MSKNPLRKVQQTVGFTESQRATIEAEAHRLGITFGDQVRRAIDFWRDNLKLGSATKDPRAQSMYRSG